MMLAPLDSTVAGVGGGGAEEAARIRKPYTITKLRESWTEPEHDKFLEALHMFDRDWRKIEAFVGSKTVIQIRSHAQKYFLKVQKNGTGEHLPPPRPKRKAAHPYPHKASKKAAQAVLPQEASDIVEHGCVIPMDAATTATDAIATNSTANDVFPSCDNVTTESLCPRLPEDLAVANNCSSSTEIQSGIWPASDMIEQEIGLPALRALPDFAQVYSFLGSVFDPETSGHLQKLREMDPIDAETIGHGYLTDAVLMNTVQELEPAGLAMVRRTLRGRVPVFPIGPLVGDGSATAADGGGVMRWLHSQAPSSVLYISFGSQNSIRLEQMMQLAAALESTGRPFVWAFRPPVGQLAGPRVGAAGEDPRARLHGRVPQPLRLELGAGEPDERRAHPRVAAIGGAVLQREDVGRGVGRMRGGGAREPAGQHARGERQGGGGGRGGDGGEHGSRDAAAGGGGSGAVEEGVWGGRRVVDDGAAGVPESHTVAALNAF